MEMGFGQPKLEKDSDLYKSGFRLPESGVSVETLEPDEVPETINIEEVFSLEKGNFDLPEESMPSVEVREKRQEYMRELLNLPHVEKINEEHKESFGVIDKILSKTLEFYLLNIPFLPYKEKIEKFLEDKLENFDPKEMKREGEKKDTVNIALVSRCIKRKDFLGAYEAFWGTWNPSTHKATRSVYDALGGNEKPVTATAGAFFYSGVFLHAMNPFVLPLYAMQMATAGPESVARIAAMITGTYVVLGIPVMINKGIKALKKKTN